MGEAVREEFEGELRRRVSRLLGDNAGWKSPRADILQRLAHSNLQAFLFGGVVRDLMVHSPYHAFRDIDVVVQGATTDALQLEFGSHVVRRTRFGGLHLDVEGWLFDLWPLADTWAFREFPQMRASPEELPRTTFMTVEAVVVSLASRPGQTRCIFESGFFEAIATRTNELNFEETPYPSLNAVRSLVTSARLGFAIGPKLIRFLTEHLVRTELEELVEVQRRHYGRVLLDLISLSNHVRAVREWERWNPGRAMPMPIPSQLYLPELDKQADFGEQLSLAYSGPRSGGCQGTPSGLLVPHERVG